VKTAIIERLGQSGLLTPSLVAEGLAANDARTCCEIGIDPLSTAEKASAAGVIVGKQIFELGSPMWRRLHAGPGDVFVPAGARRGRGGKGVCVPLGLSLAPVPGGFDWVDQNQAKC